MTRRLPKLHATTTLRTFGRKRHNLEIKPKRRHPITSAKSETDTLRRVEQRSAHQDTTLDALSGQTNVGRTKKNVGHTKKLDQRWAHQETLSTTRGDQRWTHQETLDSQKKEATLEASRRDLREEEEEQNFGQNATISRRRQA